MKKIVFLTLALVLGSAFSFSAQAQSADKDWAKFYRYAESNAALTKRPTAVLMGDSITDNWGKWDSAWFEEHNFAGRGISGQTTSQMLVRFRADVIALKPKYVVILAGINDIARNNGLIELPAIFDNIVSMVELAKLHKIKPVLCTVLPANQTNWRMDLGNPTPKILELNEMLAAYARKNRIPFVDYYSEMVSSDGALNPEWAGDPVHPNIEGYKKMEEILLSSVKFR
ncbi:MAG: acylhydrolase [Bacteroidales bacterium]|nr:acylhydrolase [Bacteroidales bacterium]